MPLGDFSPGVPLGDFSPGVPFGDFSPGVPLGDFSPGVTLGVPVESRASQGKGEEEETVDETKTIVIRLQLENLHCNLVRLVNALSNDDTSGVGKISAKLPIGHELITWDLNNDLVPL